MRTVEAAGTTAAYLGNGAGIFLLGFLLLCVAVLAVLLTREIFQRREEREEIRELLQTVEAVRDGQLRHSAPSHPHSRFAVLSDAVGRLAHDVTTLRRNADQSKDRLNAVMSASEDLAVVGTDGDGDLRHINRRAADLFGWDDDQLMGRPASLLFEEQAYKEFLPRLARRSMREKGIRCRSSMVRRDGSEFPAELSVSQMRSGSGQATGFLMVIKDLTQQVQLEQELRESEQRYRGLVEGLADPVAIVRGDRLLYVNPAFAARWQSSPAELIGTSFRERVATRDLLWVDEKLDALELGTGETAGFPLALWESSIRQPATSTTFEAVARSIPYGGPNAVLLLLRDRSAEQRAAVELRNNETQLDAILEATSDGLLVIAGDPPARPQVRMTNRAFGALTGLAPSELLGLTTEALDRDLRRAGEQAAQLADRIADVPGQEAQLLHWNAAGVDRELEIRLLPLTGSEGQGLGKVLVCRDRSAELQSERELREFAQQLQRSKARLAQAYGELDQVREDLVLRNAELDRLNEELRKLDEMKSNLLGNVSHELQTPLVSIRGYTEMISKERLGPITEEQRKGLALSLKSIDRLIGMIDNLLSFTSAESEMGRLELSKFPVAEVISEVEATVAHDIQRQGLELNLDTGTAPLTLEADREKILQVLLNLVSNAIKFTPQGGRISIHARQKNDRLAELTVRDSGRGIPADQLDRVFERHFRAVREGEAAPQGSGIGLSIVRDIVRLHGCRIEVESEEGRGSLFRLTLPLALPRPEQAGQTGQTGQGSAPRGFAVSESSNGHGVPGSEESSVQDDEDPPAQPRFRILRPKS